MKIYKHIFTILILIAVSNDLQAQLLVDTTLSEAKVEITGLSPLPFKVIDLKEPVISLNGAWEVAIDKGNKSPIQVPGELVMQGFDLNIGETAHYQKAIEIPKDWVNKRVFIRFDGVSSFALVKLNGITIVEHEGSFVPFEADITDALQKNGNLLQVDVKANTISDILACTSQYAVHTVAGILRKVTLFALPETNISDIIITTEFDKRFENAVLKIDTEITPSTSDFQKTQLKYSLYSGNKRVVQKTFPVTSNRSIASIEVKKPHHWNPESPYLYELIIELIKNDKIVQTNKQKIGFRQVEVKGSEVFVNGKAIKLHGVNRHTVHPLTGRSLSPELERLDAELFKKANCNYIRTSHYPPSEEFLNAADELGLFVESEASLTWIEHHASPIWGHWDYLDEQFLPYMLRANIENIQANKNHPSIIIWSLANESRWSPLWNKVKQVVKKMDPSRPTAFHDQCWGGFNNAGSTADIANYHYAGINGPAATDTMSRPTLFGEYSHLSTYNRRALLTDPGMRDAYNQPLVTFYDSIYRHKNNLGGAIWSGIDDTFHLPDGKIVGYGPWGPIDGWRRSKPEYFGMKKAYSPVKVMSVSELEGKLLLQIENRYDFTALSDLKIEAFVNGKPVTIKGNVDARKNGTLQILTKEKAKTFRIIFYDPNGFVAEEEFFDFNDTPVFESKENKALSYSENEQSFLIQQGEISYRISKINGAIVSVKKENISVLLQGPKFTVVPMNSENGGKNNIAGETYQRVIHPLQSFPWYMKFVSDITVEETAKDIRVNMDITFKEGNGKLSYIFKSDGLFITKYEINKIKDEVSPYQYGLMLQLPKSFEKLSWKRKGDFSLYPDDHIGRNIGTAKLNSIVTTGVEPWREKPTHAWKDDANELGSNDFRSTKRNILQVSLSDSSSNTKITVLSNTKQASRTWQQEEQINWLIADYSNNGSEPFYGTPHSNGRIKLQDRVLKGELVLLIE